METRNGSWKWWICGLLLLASALNYMDRQTLSAVSARIMDYFSLTKEQYGDLETGFGLAFAAGSLFFGWLVDKYPVRWVYPVVLVLWSAVGFCTALAANYPQLLFCRILLGFFEAGHWPCAIKTTLRLLTAKDRSMGNSVLQSGTSIGAILTPQLMKWLLTPELDSWRPAFQWIGALGIVWLVAWLLIVRDNDLREPATNQGPNEGGSFWASLLSRRMWVVLVIISLINTGWQLTRAWLMLFLQKGRGFSESEALNFNSVFYIASDVGVYAVGFLTLWLHRGGFTVHGARLWTFLGCSLLSASSLLVLVLNKGPALFFVLALVAAGSLGVFPIYHALTQEISPRHQGKITGLCSFVAWLWSPAHKFYGRWVDQSSSYDLGLALAGCAPLLAWVVLLLFWGRDNSERKTASSATG